MEKNKKCNINQFLSILLSSSDANRKLLLIATRRKIYHTIQVNVNILKYKTKSSNHILKSTIKTNFYHNISKLFHQKFLIGV